MTRPRLVGLRHVALRVRDLDAALSFWVDVMGYVVEWRPDPDNAYLTGGADNLALHRVAAGAAAGPAGAGETQTLDHIGIAVPHPADVDAWARHLEARGMSLLAAPRNHRDGSRSLYLTTPGGVVLQIIHHAPLVR